MKAVFIALAVIAGLATAAQAQGYPDARVAYPGAAYPGAVYAEGRGLSPDEIRDYQRDQLDRRQEMERRALHMRQKAERRALGLDD